MTDGQTYPIPALAATFHIFSIDAGRTTLAGQQDAQIDADHGQVLAYFLASTSQDLNRWAVLGPGEHPAVRVFRVENDRTEIVEELP
jgi:hypothetical protein